MYYLVNYFCSLTRQAKETKSFRFRCFQVFRNSKQTKTTNYLVRLVLQPLKNDKNNIKQLNIQFLLVVQIRKN